MAVPGVCYVVRIETGLATGVAVVADHTWAAMKGVDALGVSWDPGPNRNFDSDQFLRQMEDALNEPGYFVRNNGNADKALPGAARKVEAVYEFPFQVHAPLEAMNCIADVWVGRTDGSGRQGFGQPLAGTRATLKLHATWPRVGCWPRCLVQIRKAGSEAFPLARPKLQTELVSHAIVRTIPPSTRTAAPFVADASGLDRNATIDAISSGAAKRFNNEDGRIERKNSFSSVATSIPLYFAPSWRNCSTPSVRVGPANTELTVTFVSTVISARPRAKASWAVLVTP
jgi:hypothetical protein